MAVKYNRILLKVSGEALAGEKGTGFSDSTMRSICEGIRDAWKEGAQIGIVVGGGNFWRPAAAWSVPVLIRSACWQL